MKNTGDAFINRTSSLIVLISSIVMIAFMVTGGCEGDGGGTPPSATGFPPECNGTFDVDLSCPASSLSGSTCLPYVCDIVDDTGNSPEIVDTTTIIFGKSCTQADCFTLECQDIFNGPVIDADAATIVIESVSGTPVGGDVGGKVFQGTPDGRIIIDGEEFALDCNGFITP